MFHPLPKQVLYSAVKVDCFFDDYHNEKIMQGTAFMVMRNSKMFLITNRHVVDGSYSDINKSHWRLTGIKLSGFCAHNFSSYQMKFSDINPFFPVSEGEDVASILLSGLSYRGNCSGDPISIGAQHIATEEDLEKVQVSDIISFPVYHGQGEMPVMRSGWIASDPIKDFSAAGLRGDGRRIAVEAFSWQGYSGSPVFTHSHGLHSDDGSIVDSSYRRARLIGINSGHIKTADGKGHHSGLSYLVKGSCIIDLLRDK